MTKPFLLSHEANKLNSIIDQANKTFLKESRLSNNTNFNILRVLSAFRLMYPDSPTSLYNAIIYITKNYNPTSLNQWKAAVNQLSKIRKPASKEKHNASRQQISSYMKTYQNSFNKQRIQDGHFQSKSFAQIKIPADLNLSEESSTLYDHQNKDISQTNAETGKRQYYTKTDTTHYHQKNHYISFQPYHHLSGIYPHSYFQKENVNSTNIGESRKKDSSYQYLEAIRRDLGKTTKNSLVKSPIDQSFIKNIDCYQSPYLLSHPELPLDPEEQKMNERGYGFLRYNLLFKSFSSILANTLAIQKAKQHRLKAETQNKSHILQKSLQALKHNVQISQMIKAKQREANLHFGKQMKAKVMNVLKLIFELRNKQKPLKLQGLNRSSYEFILKMLLQTQKDGENAESKWIDFNLKIDQLIKKDQIEKVYLIVKYFGKHSWINQEAVQKLISSYRLSICKLAFRSLKLQQHQNRKFYQFRQKKLKRKSFKVLKCRWSKIKSCNTKIMEAEANRNRILLQTVMKSLLQVVYSTKLYSKRYEYLQKKKQLCIRKNLMGIWVQKTKQKMVKIQHLKENIKISQLAFQRFFKKYSLRAILQDGLDMEQKTGLLQCAIVNSQSKALISSLKQIVRRRKECLTRKEQMKKMWHKTALMKWKSSTRRGKGINLIIGVLKKYSFRCYISPAFKESIELLNEIRQGQASNAKLVLKHWKNWSLQQAKKYELLIQNFQAKRLFRSKLSFISLLQSHYRYEQEQRHKQERKDKQIRMAQYFQLKSKQLMLSNLRLFGQRQQSKKFNLSQIKNRLTSMKAKQTFSQLQLCRQRGQKMNSIRNMLIENSATLVIRNVSNQLVILKQKKVADLRKRSCLVQMGRIAFLCKKTDAENQKRAQTYCEQKRMTKAITGLYQLVEQRDRLKSIAQQYKKRSKLSLLKQQINELRNFIRTKKISNRIKKRLALAELKANRAHVTKIGQVVINNRWAASKGMIASMKSQLSAKMAAKLLRQKQSQLAKFMIISRIQSYFVHSLIFKKYLFMAIKYRAIRISSIVFDAWKNIKFPQKLAVKPKERISKGKERLSTDIM